MLQYEDNVQLLVDLLPQIETGIKKRRGQVEGVETLVGAMYENVCYRQDEVGELQDRVQTYLHKQANLEAEAKMFAQQVDKQKQRQQVVAKATENAVVLEANETV